MFDSLKLQLLSIYLSNIVRLFKQSLKILETKDSCQGNKEYTLLPRDQWHSKFQKIIFETFLKEISFIYLSVLVERLQGIKVRMLQNFEDFSIEKLIQIH